MNKIRIIEAVNQLGLGGTEYAVQLFSKFLDKDRFEVTVIGLLNGGERVRLIENLGIKVILLNGDLIKLGQLLQETDVFHWHGNGSLDPELFQVIKANKPKIVIQTNVFGQFDNSPFYDVIDYDLYISKMILVRRMKLDNKLQNNYASKRKVLPYPVDTDHINSLLPAEAEVNSFKKANNLQDKFIAGRIGRSDDHKFDLMTLDGFAEFAKKNEAARFLLLGSTPKISAHAASLGISDKIITLSTTSDLRQLLVYYKAMDVFLAASSIGESFGMVLAEAMTCGTPVVTISTEKRDNAQIEVIDNDLTGFVVKRDRKKIAAALTQLYQYPQERLKLSTASKQKISKDYKADKIVRSLEDLIYKHLGIPLSEDEKTLVVDYSKTLVNDYIKRCIDLHGRPEIFKRILWIFRKI